MSGAVQASGAMTSALSSSAMCRQGDKVDTEWSGRTGVKPRARGKGEIVSVSTGLVMLAGAKEGICRRKLMKS